MVVKIKSPNPDEIWEKWKHRVSSAGNLEKHYKVKGAQFTLDSITAAEYVKRVEKGAIFYFEKSHDIQPTRTKPKEVVQKVPKILKERFFDIRGEVDKSTWKHEMEVPFYSTLKKMECSTCNGTGGIKCSKCNGAGKVKCPKCGGNSANLTCKTCKGEGHLIIEIEVESASGEISKKRSQVQCPDCLGRKTTFCMKCGGQGTVACTYCEGTGKNTCSDCKGYGILYSYQVKPVPFKVVHEEAPVLHSSLDLKGLEQEIGQQIHQTIESVEGILIKQPSKQLAKKFIEPNLGYFDKTLKKTLKNVVKDWKLAETDVEFNIRLPIYLFPVLCLECETKKGKKFKIYCIGSDRKYRIFGRIK